MVVREERFPLTVGFGTGSGPVWATTVTRNGGGFVSTNRRVANPLRTFDLLHTAKHRDSWERIRDFLVSVAEGRLYGFRVRDPNDYAATSAQGRLGTTALGTGVPANQLYKRYGFGAYTKDRAIQKIVAGTLTVYRNAVAVTAGGGAGQYAVDTSTGLVTFVADDSEAITAHTVGTSHQFTTAADITGLGIGNKVYITGVTGTAATLLNSIAHTISNKTGGGPFTWTLSTNTGGSPTLTAASGTAFAFPQATDALTAAFEFDVPVLLDDDAFMSEIVATALFIPRQLTATEIRIALAS